MCGPMTLATTMMCHKEKARRPLYHLCVARGARAQQIRWGHPRNSRAGWPHETCSVLLAVPTPALREHGSGKHVGDKVCQRGGGLQGVRHHAAPAACSSHTPYDPEGRWHTRELSTPLKPNKLRLDVP